MFRGILGEDSKRFIVDLIRNASRISTGPDISYRGGGGRVKFYPYEKGTSLSHSEGGK